MHSLEESELIINSDGSIYHLHLTPDQIADTIIIVGDPQRVEIISGYFDSIEHKVVNREFITHTGTYKGKRITAMASGIGTDNIDILMNELDALRNIDLQNRSIKTEHQSLNIIRLGTSGALQADVAVDSFVASSHGFGMDGLLNFYAGAKDIKDQAMQDAFLATSNWPEALARPYFVAASDKLSVWFNDGFTKGITATAPGFYGPQGRELRLEASVKDLHQKLQQFSYQNNRIVNFEMETSALYGFGKLLGHHTITVCAVIANRYHKTYSKDYKATVRNLIEKVLDIIVQNT
jgi:uridine phosphorylase